MNIHLIDEYKGPIGQSGYIDIAGEYTSFSYSRCHAKLRGRGCAMHRRISDFAER
jgi:hypothetical protein